MDQQVLDDIIYILKYEEASCIEVSHIEISLKSNEMKIVFKADRDFFFNNRKKFLSEIERNMAILCDKTKGYFLRRHIDQYSLDSFVLISYILYFSSLNILAQETQKMVFCKLTKEFSDVLNSMLEK